MMSYVAVWFSNGDEKTAALIFEYSKVKQMTVSELSRHWPMSEAMKMKKVHRSPQFPTWDEAFHFHHT